MPGGASSKLAKESLARMRNLESDRHKIEKLKSPKPEKTFKVEWQQLIDDALNNEIDGLNDEEPFDPAQNR